MSFLTSFISGIQELFLLRIGQSEPAATVGLGEAQSDYCPGQDVFPLQPEAVPVRNIQNGAGLRDQGATAENGYCSKN